MHPLPYSTVQWIGTLGERASVFGPVIPTISAKREDRDYFWEG
jgi:hypothetical protein